MANSVAHGDSVTLLPLAGWCQFCLAKLLARNACRCEKCSAVLAQPTPLPGRCASCLDANLGFDRAFSINNYQGLLQALVIKAKNQHDEMLAAQLGRLLGFTLQQQNPNLSIDLIVPIPTHWRRRLKNGFHAALIIADAVERFLRRQEFEHLRTKRLLKCTRTTKKQGTLSLNARIKNVRGVFRCRDENRVAGQNVLLIDDVMTSGATLSEASKVLRKAGAASIQVAVVARATGIR